MILIDYNQIGISNLMMQIGGKKNVSIDSNLIRHMILNSLRMYRTKFGSKYGEIVICCDDKNYWRRELFPYYKLNRKKSREDSGLDWHTIFENLNEVREDLKNNFPYKVLKIKTAEADDIIASLCHRYGHLGIASSNAQPILIISSDKDFVQLQKYANVEQFSPIQKKMVTCSNPARYIHEHILKGDSGDGIPNFISDDDTFVTDKRQKPLSTKKIDEWNGLEPEVFCDARMLRNYHRNKQLVDLDYIPSYIQKEVIETFENYVTNDRNKMFNYFIQKKLKNLMDSIQEF